MLKVKSIIPFVFVLLLPALVSAQGGLLEYDLSYNPALFNKSTPKSVEINLRGASVYDTISLGTSGIIDNFSYEGPFPDTSLWLDEQVYINRGYGKGPISLGAATFDGLGADGYPYNFYAVESASLSADTLTSKPIDLVYPIIDSLYLSFYYQPQGLGNDPQENDSLVLEFLSPDSGSQWSNVWAKEGSVLSENDSSWNLVMIPIINTSYLKKGFQFRFRNYATISGNLDHWHIDNIYLNRIRTINDTIFTDISWVYDGNSLLNNYKTMPWRQYTSSELKSSIQNLIRNNDTTLRNLSYDYEVINETSSTKLDSFNAVSNIRPFSTNNVYTDCDVVLGCISSAGIIPANLPASLSAPTVIKI